MLTDRRQQVLAALIREYVAHAIPVASRTLAQEYQLGVSPATVRNDLSALENGGYIRQPHTSAGRIPTDNGYRSFVDSLLESAGIADDEQLAGTFRELRQHAVELDELMAQTAAALTRFTDCLSIVLPARAETVALSRIGLSALMQQPEFSSSVVLLPLLRMIEDDSLLVYIGNAAGEGVPVVRIGHENGDESLGNLSIVCSRFGHGDGSGIIAVVGPTRMDYERALCAVQAARCELDEI